MDQYLVDFPRITGSKLIQATVPGSKSITNRALLLAALQKGPTTLHGCLASEDGRVFLECLKTLGFRVKTLEEGVNLEVTLEGTGGEIPVKQASIYVGSAGTAARFLAALLAFSDGEYLLDASEQMKKRPIRPLAEALLSSGATVEYLEEEGHFPLKIMGAFHPSRQPAVPREYTVNIDQSSQFLSALLIAAGALSKRLGKAVRVNAVGSHGLSYVYMTVSMMQEFGILISEIQKPCSKEEPHTAEEETCTAGKETPQVSFVIDGYEAQGPLEYTVEPDMSAACYFYALAGILGITVEVENLRPPLRQGDEQFVKVLERMGCQAKLSEAGVLRVTGPKDGKLKGSFTQDLSSFGDQALTLAAMAPYADGPITMTGIQHLRFQECDRIYAMTKNLRALGIQTEVTSRDGDLAVTVYPGRIQGAEIQTYQDHRVAMAFSLAGLRAEGVRILDPDCCKKTFREYFSVLDDIKRQLMDDTSNKKRLRI